MLLSVVLSFRNEEEVLDELIKRLENTLNPLDLEYELIFVNDSSTDGSLDILLEHRQQNKRIKIINVSRRFGVSPCVMAGFKHATGDAVVYMDADLQDPPELIPTLIEKWKEGADVVHTTRTKRKGESPFKIWLTRLAYKVINLISDIEVLEETGDFKLLSRRAVNELLRFKERDPFMRGLVLWIGLKQVQVFYEREPRFAGKTKFSLLRSLSTNPGTPPREFIRGLTFISSVPLYFALLLGSTVSLGAFVFLIYIIIEKVFFGIGSPGWPAMMATILFLGGTILFTIGILGIYVGKIHREIKNRPLYIIESKIGFDEDADE